MKRYKVIISMVLVFIIAMSSVVTTFATTLSYSDNKVSEQLKEAVSKNRSGSVSVCIFLNECDKTEVYSNLKVKYNYNVEAYENKELYYDEVVPNVTVGDRRVSEILNVSKVEPQMLSLDKNDSPIDINTRKSINKAMIGDVNKFISCYREEISNIVGSYVAEFVRDNEELLDEIILQPKSGEFVVAQVNSSNISKLAKLAEVCEIDIFSDEKECIQNWNATPIIGSDSETGIGSENYNYGDGFDGSGVRIGIIEAWAGKYDADNYNLTDANLSFVPTPGAQTATVSSHATNVTALICGKKVTINGKTYEGAAKGATVYQTAVVYQSDVINAIEMFAEMDIDVINYSGGRDTGTGYHSYDKMVDYLLENNRLLLVNAAGNEGGSTKNVISPAKAYNALTVGNLETKESSEQVYPAPYSICGSSSTKEDDYLANKPDVVAPGTAICLPTSSTEWANVGSGTSYSAPLVTAMAAQIMQSDSLAIFNPNAAKNYIICGASNNDITGTTVSYGALMDESGAGLVNAVNTYECSNFGTEYYGVYLASQNAPTDYKTVATFDLAMGEHLRIALTFEKEEAIELLSEYGNNIDIRLVRDNPYTTYCVASESTNNNVELIDTWITTTGEYCLQVRLTDSILDANTNNDLHYWLSWRTY